MVFSDGTTVGERDSSTLVARLRKENVDFIYYDDYHSEMRQILRQAHVIGLKTQFMKPKDVANVSLSGVTDKSVEGLLVARPKNYDQIPANRPVVSMIRTKKQDSSGTFV